MPEIRNSLCVEPLRPRGRSPSRERPRTAGAAYPAISTRAWMSRRPSDIGAELDPPAQNMAFFEGSQLFVFPTPSPRVGAPRSATFPTAPLPSATSLDSPRIGIALGSPSQAAAAHFESHPHPWTFDHSLRIPVEPAPIRTPPCPPPKENATKADSTQESQPTRKSSWKAFRNMFGRKPAKPVTTVEPAFVRPALTPNVQEIPALPFPTEPRQRRWLPPMPKQNKPSSKGSDRSDGDRRAPSNDEPRTSIPERKDSPLSHTSFSPSGTPLLEVKLPNPTMDRYSIMFEKLLASEGPKTSLLERRQSKMQRGVSMKRLEPIHDADERSRRLAGLPQRSLTSPHLARIPSLSIKVTSSNKSTDASARRSQLIRRSNTAPPGSVSPVVQVISVPDEPNRSSDLITPALATGISYLSTPITADREVVFIFRSQNNTTNGPPSARSLLREPSWDLLSNKSQLSPYISTPTSKSSSSAQLSTARQVSVISALKGLQGVRPKLDMRPRVVSLHRDRSKSTPALVDV